MRKMDFGRGSYCHLKLALPSSFPRRGRLSQRRSAGTEEVISDIFEHKIPSTGMWSDSRLKDLSIESKNT